MKYTILLSRLENTKTVEEQEQSRFIKSVLESLEIPVEYDPETDLSVEDKARLRKEFADYNINVLSDIDGGLEVLLGREPIAIWKKMTYKLKTDLSEIRPEDRLYLEATVDFWTIFEDEEEGGEEQVEEE